MKRIVNGKLYDTTTATIVCSWRETTSVFGIEIEAQFTLYRETIAEKPQEGLKLGTWGGVLDYDVKKDASKGDFFLATQVGGACGPGRIRPLSVDEARRIFEERTSSDYGVEDEYEKYFGVRPQKPMLEQLKEAFAAGAAAKQKQYEEEEAKKRSEGAQ